MSLWNQFAVSQGESRIELHQSSEVDNLLLIEHTLLQWLLPAGFTKCVDFKVIRSFPHIKKIDTDMKRLSFLK